MSKSKTTTKSSTKSKVKAVVASPIIERTPAADYAEPVVTKIATDIKVKDESFFPVASNPGSPSVDLVANIPSDDSGNSRIALSNRSTAVIDCGFKFRLPPGYRAYITPKSNLADRGLVVTSTYLEGESEVKVTVINVGREILFIEDKQHFAEMIVQPVYTFNWIVG